MKKNRVKFLLLLVFSYWNVGCFSLEDGFLLDCPDAPRSAEGIDSNTGLFASLETELQEEGPSVVAFPSCEFSEVPSRLEVTFPNNESYSFESFSLSGEGPAGEEVLDYIQSYLNSENFSVTHQGTALPEVTVSQADFESAISHTISFSINDNGRIRVVLSFSYFGEDEIVPSSASYSLTLNPADG